MTNITPHEGALLNEQATRILVQDWTTYLRSRLTLMLPNSTEDAFERDSGSIERTNANRDLAVIPHDLRSMFERAVTQRREQHRQRQESTHSEGSLLVDPELVDRTALQELLTEATEPDQSGHILVPSLAEHGAIDWLEFRAADLTSRPDQHAYRMANRGQADREKSTRIAAGIAIVVLLILAVWSFLRPDESPTGVFHNGATANGQNIPAWYIRQIRITADTNAAWNVTPANSQAWPTDGQAHTDTNAALPLQVCIPSDTLSAIHTAQIIGDGSTPNRIYAISSIQKPGAEADLLLVSCSDTSIRVIGMLQSLELPVAYSVGSKAQYGEQPITLLSHTVIGTAADSSVPQNAMRVAMRFQTDPIDWTASAPTLRLGDGSQHTAPEVILLEGNLTELRFLVPTMREALPAELRLTRPNGTTLSWQLVIGPAADRQSVLQAALSIGETSLNAGGMLNLPVTNNGSQPFSLNSADLFIEQNGTHIAPASISGIEAPIAPGETRMLIVTLPSDLYGIATLTIGTAQFQLSE